MQPLDVIVQNLSATGFCFSSTAPIAIGTAIRVGLAGAGQADAEVAWRDRDRYGCLFTPSLTHEALDEAFTNDAIGIAATIVRVLPGAVFSQIDMPSTNLEQGSSTTLHVAPFVLVVLAMLTGSIAWVMISMLLHQI